MEIRKPFRAEARVLLPRASTFISLPQIPSATVVSLSLRGLLPQVLGDPSLEEAVCLGKPRVQLQPARKDASLHKAREDTSKRV